MVLTESDIKTFFKSLLDYIPISNPNRLDDIIKKNESYLQSLASEAADTDPVKCLNRIYECVLEAKQFGITLVNLRAKITPKPPRMNLLKKLLDLLLGEYLILAVGVVERVYVAHEFKQHWVIQSYKSLKGRGGQSLDESHHAGSASAVDADDVDNDDRSESKRTRRAPQRADEAENQAESKNFKPVCLIPRPWRYIDGLLNRPVLKKMLESLLVYLKTYPQASVESIVSHFCPVLQPIMTIELLEMLEKLKCVQKLTLKRELDCDLFSDFTNGSCELVATDYDENDPDLLGDETFAYYLNQNSMFTFKKVFPD